jgi:hypothetical protein
VLLVTVSLALAAKLFAEVAHRIDGCVTLFM